jgi:multiple sugar transport system permease protein
MYFGQMDSGAGSSAALFYVVYLFRQAFEFLNMGYASAMAWLLFVVILIITLIQLRVSKSWVYYEGR